MAHWSFLQRGRLGFLAANKPTIFVPVLVCALIVSCYSVVQATHDSSKLVKSENLDGGHSLSYPDWISIAPDVQDQKQPQQACRDVHFVYDQCSFVNAECEDEEAGLLSYLDLYFCKLPNAKPLTVIILIGWLGVLFSSIGISASDFLCVNLSTMANMLGMSQSLAGVTFLAFGNGSPDVFSTFAAFSTHSGSLAVGELIGAAGFITAVIAGSVAIVQPFKVAKRTFIRDVLFFTVAAAFSMVFLVDGHLALWECIVMVCFYATYVVTVLAWHSILHRRNKGKDRQSRARHHFESAGPADAETCSGEPSNLVLGDMDALGPGDTPEGQPEGVLDNGAPGEDEDDETRERFLADISRRMQITGPRRTFSRMASSGQSIRPSLLGALEFGAVLSSAEPTHTKGVPYQCLRRHSDDPSHRQRTHTNNHADSFSNSSVCILPGQTSREVESASSHPSFMKRQRLRAVSANAADILGDLSSPATHLPKADVGATLNEVAQLGMTKPRTVSAVPCIVINGDSPSTVTISPIDSPTTMFPQYTDDPDPTFIASPVDIVQEELGLWSRLSRPISQRWLALCQMTPSFWMIRTILLPTVENWRAKGALDKLLSLIAIPTILILTLTVPVVETDKRASTIGPLGKIETDLGLAADGSTATGQGTRIIDRELIHSTFENDTLRAGVRDGSGIRLHRDRSHSDERNLPGTATEAILDNGSDTMTWQPWLLAVQTITSPLFLLLAFGTNFIGGISQLRNWFLFLPLCSCIILILFLGLIEPHKPPAWQPFLAFPGFLVSIAWISLIANEVVGVLKALGVITGISDAILGLTIFAVGNSCGDLFANLVIARLGYPVMALSACFGGPMLNILLGIGMGGMYMTIRKGHKHSYGGNPTLSTQLSIEVGRTLIISGVGLLLTLIGLLIVVPLNGWRMDQKIGSALIALWCTTIIINIVLEIAPI